MRRNKPLAVVAGAAMFALAACGGSGDDGDGPEGSDKTFQEQSDDAKDAERQAPAEEVEGAETGGTITVFLPGDAGPTDLDPTGGWTVTGNSIQQALTSRSLTQYARDPETGTMTLVPDLATDLGTPNDDFTEWTFTIRDDAKWENGQPITAEEVAFGICRSMDSENFPSGPGTEYSQTYFHGAGEYKGPYSEKDDDACTKWGGVSVEGQDVTIKMSKSFPDMDYWAAFMAMGPSPLGKASRPPNYGQNIVSNGPYKVESFRAHEELVLVKNDQWDPNTDPARHQYADKWIFKFDQDPAQVDQIMLSGNTESQTAVSTLIGTNNYQRANAELGDRLLQQSSQCTSFLAPDYTKITDIRVRKAIAYGYPYEDVWLASGEVVGVTRVPANSIMPPGMAGRRDYFVDGEQFTYNPNKAKELLAEAGYEPGEFEITMIYYEAHPLAAAAQKQFERGMTEAGFSVKAIPVQVSPDDIWTDPDNEINQQLNLRGAAWCSDWPSGLTMVPPLTKTGSVYNTAFFSEPEIDEEMDSIVDLPLEEQADAWGALDEKIGTEYLPLIPTAFRNDLFAFGSRIGNPAGDGSIGAPYYKGLYVTQ